MKLKEWLEERVTMHPGDMKKTIEIYYNKLETPTQREIDRYIGGKLKDKLDKLDREELQDLFNFMERKTKSAVLY